MTSSKPELLMLVPHEPTLDPRIHYTANTLATEYRVKVLGVVRDFERRPGDNYPSPPLYETDRIFYRHEYGIAAARDFVRIHNEGRVPFGSGIVARVAGAAGFCLATFAFAAMTLRDHAISWRRTCGQNKLDALPIVKAPAGSPSGLRSLMSVSRYALQASGLLWQHIVEQGLRPQVVYCHDLQALQAAVMLKQRARCLLVYDSHEYFPFQAPGRIYERTVRLYEQALVPHVDLYLTVSPQLADELQSVYGVSKVYAFPNVEPRPPAPPYAFDTEMDRLAAGRLKVLYQGAFAPQRGLEEILADWRAVNGEQAALFLRGPGNSVLDNLEIFARERGLLGKSVFVLPPVLERDLIAAAAEADVGLVPYKNDQPSYRFACPNKLSQYIHAGLAVISNDMPFVAHLLAKHDVGLVYDARQPGSFAAVVGMLCENPDRLATYRQNASALSRGEYAWEHYEPRLLDLIRDLRSRYRQSAASVGAERRIGTAA